MKSLPNRRIKLTIKDTYLETLLPRFKEERIRAFLTLASTLLAISIFGFFAINPTLTTIAQLKKQLSDSQFVDQKLVQKIANLSSLQQSYVQLQDNIPTIMNAVPTVPTIPLFIAQVQSVGQSSHVNLLKIQTLPVEMTADIPSDKFISFAFSIDATGSVITLSNFITAIESFDRLITVDGIAISRPIENPAILQLNFKGRIYFKKV